MNGRFVHWYRPAACAARGFLVFGLSVLLLSVSACSKVTVFPLTEETFPAKPKGAQIKLYVYKVQRPHSEIAYIDSQPLPDRAEQSQEKQLLQIREAARKLGADAVHDIQSMTERVQGLVVDQNVPFQAYKQGRYKLYFIRGTAIVYRPEVAKPEPEPTVPEPELLEQEASPSEPVPPEPEQTPVLAPLIEGSNPSTD